MAVALAALMMPMDGAAQTGSADTRTDAEQGVDERWEEERGLDLEELLDTEIVSASRKTERLVDAATAIYVVTQQDIRRSGATSIPEALRMVPGLQVSRLANGHWVIAARGFAGLFATKLLVLIDGRSVYTPIFSGVYWDEQDVMLEDIERIEVIRGAGGTLWGANAVTGVINIITKNSADTVGSLVTFGGGTEERAFAAVRHGVRLDEDTTFRVWAKWFDRDGQRNSDDSNAPDSWDGSRVGFRLDRDLSESDRFTLQGDLFDSNLATTSLVPSETVSPFAIPMLEYESVYGGNLLGRWQRRDESGAETVVQAYYDGWSRTQYTRARRHTADLDTQHTFEPWGPHTVMVGFGYRYNELRAEALPHIYSRHSPRGDNLWSVFVNDSIDLVEDRLALSVGTKVEHNDYTGYEIQPDARIRWSIDEQHTLWGAVARAVRTPSWINHDAVITFGSMPGSGSLPLQTVLSGDDGFQSENALTFDLGYRFQNESDTFSLDLATFFNRFDDLSSFDAGATFMETFEGNPRIVLPATYGNRDKGESYGGELALTWRASERLRLAGSYSLLRLDQTEGAGTLVAYGSESLSPRNMASLRAYWDVTEHVSCDLSGSYTDHLSAGVPSFVRVDARLGWKFGDHSELEVVGQNLLDDRHPEFVREYRVTPTELERGAYVQFTMSF
ncbi:MAG: TonB-dependent receptor [Planctomycetes bacterium]|nr:TonB-dependent receptor [Planctomycetota bacterium]